MDELDKYIFCPQCASKLSEKTIDNENVKECRNCGFIFWNKPKPVVSILIHKDGKVLMLKRASEPFKDYWVLPGGFIKARETAEDAILREAKEEIDSNIKIEKIIGTYLIDNDPRGTHLDIIFSGQVENEIKINKENQKFDFFSTNNLPEKIAYKHRDAIEDWHRIVKV